MQRKVKEILPKTFEELKALLQDERARAIGGGARMVKMGVQL